MGTNYYIETEPRCHVCGRGPGEPRHIGKQSAGWKFILHGSTFLKSWDQWKIYLRANVHSLITDEYGTMITTEEMITHIESHQEGRVDKYDRIDPDGYRFCDGEFG